MGAAYGILMDSKGYGVGWTFLMSALAYGGSGQYVAITFLTSIFNPVQAFLMTLMVNARHIFYGISMLEKYKDAGKLKPFLIFSMCDETFSLVYSTEAPEGVDKYWFMFFISLLNYIYWLMGSVLGGILGSMVEFNTKYFVLTALFVVIFLSHWRQKIRKTALIGYIPVVPSYFSQRVYYPCHDYHL